MMLISATAFAEKENDWNGWNNPSKMDSSFEYRFKKLPKSGKLKERFRGWQGYHWANNKGGIAHRWQSKRPMDFKYKSPSLEKLKTMSNAQINKLSPAEKYDIFMGEYNYPTVRMVWAQTRKGHSDWYGICHGVSPSSLNHDEPDTISVQNKDGIEITFYSADVKAIMAYFYARQSDSKVVQVGKRCFVAGWLPIVRRLSGCTDMNAGAFHVMLANQVGIKGIGVIADLERYAPVWNHPAVNYNTKVLSRGVGKVLVQTNVNFAASIDPEKEPVMETGSAKFETKEYKYWLELDSSGKVTGGSWVSGIRPDFMWSQEKDQFSGYWRGINQIYRPR